MRKRQLISFLAVMACGAALLGGQSRSLMAGDTLGAAPLSAANRFDGRYAAGAGNVADLKLIDDSFAFFHANPDVPNLTMLYAPQWDSFTEGAQWPAWWIQNSYGFSYAATPFLQEPWISALQRSWDHFWNNQGDGKRMGLWDWRHGHYLASLVAPDGCLGDCAAPGSLDDPAIFPGMIAYRQGDGNRRIHDWFYEATAAGVVMQVEILLRRRDPKSLAYYLPKMDRACNCIEKTRDAKNGLFLVGPACDLLAPAYGGVKQPDGTFGRGYLAGLSITYLAALDRMVELYQLAGDRGKLADYRQRQEITRRSLPQFLTPQGYFVKSVEPGGIKHGVLGQEKFGYLDGVANADAAALRVVDDATVRTIYGQIESFPAIRPFEFLLTNAPGLDDMYSGYGSTEFKDSGGRENIWKFGCWVNGGVWGTVEGRAILMYYRLGRFDDVRRSAQRAWKWARDFRMEDHLTQRGENTHNLWYDKGPHLRSNIAVTIDNFAIPAATIRGLFDYDYRWDRLILRPRLPDSIREYVQKEPAFFGEKTLYLSCRNSGPQVKSVTVNGQAVAVDSPDAAVLPYDALPKTARIEIVTGAAAGSSPIAAASTFVAGSPAATEATTKLPETLKTPAAVMAAMIRLLAQEPGADEERAFVHGTLGAIEAWRRRPAVAPHEGFFRPMSPEKNALILAFYETAARRMYDGFAQRMASYTRSSDARKLRIARLFRDAQSS